MRLNVLAFALAFGLWWGAGVFPATWWLVIVGSSAQMPMMLDAFYPGYSVSPVGSIVGLVYGMICGAICGAILAWLYNFFAARVGESKTAAA